MKIRLLSAFYAFTPNLSRAAQQVLIQKIIAITFGPSGFLVFGAISNFLSVTNTLALGGLFNGLVSRLTINQKRLTGIEIRGIAILTLMGAATSVCVLFIGIHFVKADWIKNISKISVPYIACIMAISYIGYSISNFVNAFLVSSKNFKTIAAIGLSSAVLSIFLFLISFLALKKTGELLLWAPAMYPIGFGIFSIFFIKKFHIKWELLLSKKKWFLGFKIFLPFSGMAISSAILTPLSSIYLLDVFQNANGNESAGIFLALTRMSDIVGIFIGPVISTYIYPMFIGAIGDKPKLNKIYPKIAIMFLITLLCYQFLAFFSKFGMAILFSDKFIISTDECHIFLLSEAFRMLTVMLAYLVISSGSFFTYLMFDFFGKAMICLMATLIVPTGGIFRYSIGSSIIWIILALCIIIWAEIKSDNSRQKFLP